MNRYSRIVFTLLFVVALSIAAAGQTSWLGHYEFVEDGGKTAGGTSIVVTHQIDVLNSDDGLVATLRSNGYQTSVDLLCLVKVNGNKALLFFEGYGDANIFENYEKGQLMLTLELKDEKGKSEILTQWGAFKPIAPKNERPGKVYFTKVDSNKK